MVILYLHCGLYSTRCNLRCCKRTSCRNSNELPWMEEGDHSNIYIFHLIDIFHLNITLTLFQAPPLALALFQREDTATFNTFNSGERIDTNTFNSLINTLPNLPTSFANTHRALYRLWYNPRCYSNEPPACWETEYHQHRHPYLNIVPQFQALNPQRLRYSREQSKDTQSPSCLILGLKYIKT